ncbi:GNAT family N-acetyltransferase [Pseudomonas citri]|uniref:GNAT family N-acetyltransferase n=1 Tax=Pseudomonas citri TaxID=2978349 RepID=UPI0021B5A8BB|nr:GNAT family N-acetyltransferase [Pseudomonas citri]
MSSSQRPLYFYRAMTAADVPSAHALSVQLKWPHRLEDWAMLQRVAQGFVVEDQGRLIGTAFTCTQGRYATIGLVIVDDEYQGQGIGRKLMELAIEACGSRTAILNATLAGAPLYASQGFVDFGHIQQHQGQALSLAPQPLSAGERCRPLSEADQAELIELANAGSGLDRSAVLNDLFDIVEHAVVIEQNGHLCGFAMLRPFGRGRSIGPVVAQTPEQARHMIAELLTRVPDTFVRIDIPSDSDLAAFLEEAGLKQIDTVAQMALGAPPEATGAVQQFALVTQAIG